MARFEGFELDLRTAELRRSGEPPQKLSDQPFQILAMLLEHPGDLVTREEIRKSLWPNGTIVEFEHSINAAMNRLRLALGDSAENPLFIETLARRGYRWKTPVNWVEPPRETQEPAKPESAAIPQSPVNGNWTGKKVSHYRVLEIIGGGGMGVVYKAEDLKLDRRVALKFLPEELANDPAAMQRFEREARAASALNHPNICTIYEVEEHEGQPFIVMELLEGRTLRELIPPESKPSPKNPPIPISTLLDIAVQIAAGLEAAHGKGIVHRDIKPANIFVTTTGHVKILDFGLAKLQEFETVESEPQGSQSSESKKVWSPYLTLTRTGTPIGTAGYMSPEQIRGEKLDARTDLFNLGLVLYDMAAGRRAFTGETVPALQSAILNSTPISLRQVRSEIPPKLEGVVSKALEKNRDLRFQSTAQIRAELEALKQPVAPHVSATLSRGFLLGAVALLLIVVALFGISRPPPRAPEPKLRQLTTNSFENRVTSGAISPDGKYLAYSDMKGLYIKLIETGEIHSVPQPQEIKERNVVWNRILWLPDSNSFIANLIRSAPESDRANSQGSSFWMASVLGEAPRKIRDGAFAYSISPDGSWITFTTNNGKLGDREIWLARSNGGEARKLIEIGEDSALSGPQRSPDGKRLLYVKSDRAGDTLLTRDELGGSPRILFAPETMKFLTDFFWLADGRLFYSNSDHGPSAIPAVCDNQEMRLNAQTGAPAEKPKPVAVLAGTCISNMSETSDGKKLAFLKSEGKQTSLLGDLAENGRRIVRTRHFPLSESSEAIVDWASDSKTTILVSDRSGIRAIYKQSLVQNIAEPVLPEGYNRDPRVTPDGQSLLYLGIGEKGPWPARGPEPVMRVSIAGGSPQYLFTARPYSLMSCARSPSSFCVIAEPVEEGKELAFSVVDPIKGRGSELFRFALIANDDTWWLDLSPDGTRVAASRTLAGPIYILSSSGKELQQVRVKGWSNVESFSWSANGDGLFVTARIQNGKSVLYVDLLGNAHLLWENSGASGETLAYPSPDGRHLALQGWTKSANLWLMENF
jgi:eukaryotic-like serine/threonine-protein kinase